MFGLKYFLPNRFFYHFKIYVQGQILNGKTCKTAFLPKYSGTVTQMVPILRAKVKISSKVKILKNALKKNDGYKGQKNLGWLSSFIVSL